jgi:hypothetical protein
MLIVGSISHVLSLGLQFLQASIIMLRRIFAV